MLEHVLRLLWNRRKASRLVIVEVAAAFLVVFVVCALALHAWGNYRRPLGFTYENTWRVMVVSELGEPQPGKKIAGRREAMDDIVAAVRQIPGVSAAHAITSTPFSDTGAIAMLGRQGAPIVTMHITLSGDALKDLGVHVLQGRSFGPQDDGQEYQAALVNREFVKLAFDGASPVGRRINFTSPESLSRLPPEQARYLMREVRVVGIIDDFRQHGELAEPGPYVIYSPVRDGVVPTELFVKVPAGTDRRLEEQIVARVKSAARGHSATVTPWQELRATNHLQALLPLRIGATLATFLLAMVALGLIGIVWQDVVRRTQEIGVRRAAGASARAVRAQILLEMLAIGCAGVVIGSLVAIQFPLLAIVKQIDWAAALPALGLAAFLVLLLAAGAALYPALLASRREPADALRYE
jgi:putative ABC transport system permease protein